MASSLGIHVTNDLGFRPSRAPISDHPTPIEPGDNTPRIMNDWGQQSCRTRQANTSDIHTN